MSDKNATANTIPEVQNNANIINPLDTGGTEKADNGTTDNIDESIESIESSTDQQKIISNKLSDNLLNRKNLLNNELSNEDILRENCIATKNYINSGNLNEYITNIKNNISDKYSQSEILSNLFYKCNKVNVDILSKISGENTPIQCISDNIEKKYIKTEQLCKEFGVNNGYTEFSWNNDLKICLLAEKDEKDCNLQKINVNFESNSSALCRNNDDCVAWSVNYENSTEFNNKNLTTALATNDDLEKWKTNTKQNNASKFVCEEFIRPDKNNQDDKKSFYNKVEDVTLSQCKLQAYEIDSFNYSWIPQIKSFDSINDLKNVNNKGTCIYFDKNNMSNVGKENTKILNCSDEEKINNTVCSKHKCNLVESKNCMNESKKGIKNGLTHICFHGEYNSDGGNNTYNNFIKSTDNDFNEICKNDGNSIKKTVPNNNITCSDYLGKYWKIDDDIKDIDDKLKCCKKYLPCGERQNCIIDSNKVSDNTELLFDPLCKLENEKCIYKKKCTERINTQQERINEQQECEIDNLCKFNEKERSCSLIPCNKRNKESCLIDNLCKFDEKQPGKCMIKKM
jgi:hypothetical protein